MKTAAILMERLQRQVAGLNEDLRKLYTNFDRFVIDLDSGLWVKFRHLERTVTMMNQAQDIMLKDLAKISDLDDSVEALETAHQDRKNTRRWGFREVLIPMIVALVTLLLGTAAIRALGW